MSEQSDNEIDAMAIGLSWMKDSSLEKWFPITAEQIAQLTKERDDLQIKLDERGAALDFSELACERITKERDQLAAKCAEMRDILTDIEMCNEEYERVCPGCHEPIMDADENILETEHSPTCRFVHALSDQCGVGLLSPKQQDEEIGRWQEAIYDLCCKFCPDINIDGAGCDSGDPLDFTLSEIGQALAHLQNKIDERLSPEKKKVLVEVLDEVMKEHSATMREVSEIGYSEGLCLNPSLYLKAKQALEVCK